MQRKDLIAVQTLAATMGYNPTITLLLCAPPWIFATMVALAATKYVEYTIPQFILILQ